MALAAASEWRKHCDGLATFVASELSRERLAQLMAAPLQALSSSAADDGDDDDEDDSAGGGAAAIAAELAAEARGAAAAAVEGAAAAEAAARQVQEAVGVALEDLKLHVVGSLAEEAAASVEELAEAASAQLDELDEAAGGMVGESGAAAVAELIGAAVERASLSSQAKASRVREAAAAEALALARKLRLLDGAAAAALRARVMEEVVALQVMEPSPRVKALLACKDRGPTESELVNCLRPHASPTPRCHRSRHHILSSRLSCLIRRPCPRRRTRGTCSSASSRPRCSSDSRGSMRRRATPTS